MKGLVITSIFLLGIVTSSTATSSSSPNGMKIQQFQIMESPSISRTRQLQEGGPGSGSALEQKWYIEEPHFKYENLQFDLEYVTSDEMSDVQISYDVYDGHQCRGDGNGGDSGAVNSTTTTIGNVDITNATYLVSQLRPDLTEVNAGINGRRTFKVTLNINSDEITSSPIFEDYETYAHVTFCVRFTNWNMDYFEEDAVEVNFIETPVLLVVNLVDTFEIDLSDVADEELVVELAYDDSAVEGYICDNLSNVVEGDSRSQGESVRVCVTPAAETLAQGAYIRYVDEFTFERGDYTQTAIEAGTGGDAASQLTIVSCPAGSLICAFETLLGAQFFEDGVGIVYGSGTAFLQFGQDDEITEEETNRQRQRQRRNRRNLQNGKLTPAEALAERPTAFAFEIVMIPQDNEFAQSGGSVSHPHGMKLSLWILTLVVVGTTYILGSGIAFIGF